MRTLAITTFVLVALAMGFSAQPAQAEVSVTVTIGGFHDELAPYGRWVNCRYGQCWVPRHVARRWQPYTNGRWVYTEYGWTWVSRDPWGGSPYHYGTWIYLRGYGWSWVPGTVWAPAWVTWSYSDRYVGWAPLPPSLVFGASGYSGRPVVVSQTQYVFVPTNRFVDTDVTSVRVSAQQSATIFRQSKRVTHFGVSDGIVRNTGIPMETIQRATGSRIETRNISAANTTPRSLTAGGSGRSRQVAVVAPAREVNAAIAARPPGASRPAPSSRADRGGKAQVSRESTSAGPQTRQESTAARAAANPPPARQAPPAQSRGQAAQSTQARQESTAARAAANPPPARQARPVQSRGQASQSAQSRQESTAPRAAANPPQARQAPPAQSHGQAAQVAPAERRREPPPRAAADPGARPVPAPAAQAAAPKQDQRHEKPVKKEKEKDQKDEKH